MTSIVEHMKNLNSPCIYKEISLFPRKSWKFSSNGNSVDSDLLLTIQFPGQRGSLNDFMQPLSIFLLGKKKS